MAREIHYKKNLKIYWELVKEYKLLVFLTFAIIILMQAITLVIPFIFKQLVDKGGLFVNGTITNSAFVEILFVLLLAYGLSVLIYSLCEWFRISILIKLDSNLKQSLKNRFFNHLIGLSHDFHASNKTGTLISRMVRGGSSIESLTDTLTFQFLPLIFQYFLVSAALFVVDWRLPLIVTGLIITFLLINFYLLTIAAKIRLIRNEAEDKERANIADTFTNIDSIKYFGKELKIKKRFKGLTENTRKSEVKSWAYHKVKDTLNFLVTSIFSLFIILIPIFGVINGTMSLGTLVFVWSAFRQLLGPLHGFTWGMRNFYRAMTDLEQLFRYEDVENEIKDTPNAKILKIKQGRVEFKNVNFSYDKNRKILEKFNLKIGKNQKIAFVGLSGAGKSTIVKLLYRFYDPDFGQVLIDGIDIKEFKQESVRSEMSIVPQEAILFDDTIYNNIAFSKTNASEEEVWKAIKFAQLDEFINGLPKKGNTIVGERGVKLSGGEKQRVSIARAILADKKILVLDEATSAMDSETEFFIQNALTKLMKNRTTIIIAHRLSTIMHADKIVVIDKGKIKETGTHKELIKTSKIYKKLWTIQKGGYIK